MSSCATHVKHGAYFIRAMRTLPTSCHMVTHMQRRRACITWRAHAGMPATLCIHGMLGVTYGCAIHAS